MLEIQGDTDGLLDEPLHLRVRGAGGEPVTWRARYRDDDGRVWRATAERPEGLDGAWAPAKPAPGLVAALQSLHPVRVDVRAETADGRSATRTVTRRLVAAGVRVRRWRDGVTATLYLPVGAARTTLLLDATAGPAQAGVAAVAAALLASRGARVLVVAPPGRKDTGAPALDVARERLAAVPGVDAAAPVELPVHAPGELGDGVVLPAGVGVAGEADAAARVAAWISLLARLGVDGPVGETARP